MNKSGQNWWYKVRWSATNKRLRQSYSCPHCHTSFALSTDHHHLHFCHYHSFTTTTATVYIPTRFEAKQRHHRGGQLGNRSILAERSGTLCSCFAVVVPDCHLALIEKAIRHRLLAIQVAIDSVLFQLIFTLTRFEKKSRSMAEFGIVGKLRAKEKR